MLYHNKTAYTKEELIKFQRYHFEKVNGTVYKINTALSILIIAIAIFLLILNDYIGFIYLLIGIFLMLFMKFLPNIHFQLANKKNKILSDLENDYQFDEDFIEIKNSISTSRIKYDQLYKVYESDFGFYLYISWNQGFIMNKNNFLKGTSDEFSNFIASQVTDRYRYKK